MKLDDKRKQRNKDMRRRKKVSQELFLKELADRLQYVIGKDK